MRTFDCSLHTSYPQSTSLIYMNSGPLLCQDSHIQLIPTLISIHGPEDRPMHGMCCFFPDLERRARASRSKAARTWPGFNLGFLFQEWGSYWFHAVSDLPVAEWLPTSFWGYPLLRVTSVDSVHGCNKVLPIRANYPSGRRSGSSFSPNRIVVTRDNSFKLVAPPTLQHSPPRSQ